MSEALAPPQPDTTAAQEPARLEVATSAIDARDVRLHALLDADYDYAKKSGLVDMFDYRPKQGVDGLMHTLIGDVETGGFHHEPSGEAWGFVKGKDGQAQPVTRVDREHLETAKSSQRRWFKERPAEPYLAKIAIGDRPKMEFTKGPDGSVNLSQTRNAMYPKEYDALGVMQAIKQAVDTQEVANARQSVDSHGEPVLVTQGEATLMNGTSKMPIRLILNADTKQVKAAFPMISGKNPIENMDLTPDQMWDHATGKAT